MKRSEVNTIMQEADEFIRKSGFYLPPFAYWTPAEWRRKGEEAREIVEVADDPARVVRRCGEGEADGRRLRRALGADPLEAGDEVAQAAVEVVAKGRRRDDRCDGAAPLERRKAEARPSGVQCHYDRLVHHLGFVVAQGSAGAPQGVCPSGGTGGRGSDRPPPA